MLSGSESWMAKSGPIPCMSACGQEAGLHRSGLDQIGSDRIERLIDQIRFGSDRARCSKQKDQRSGRYNLDSSSSNFQ